MSVFKWLAGKLAPYLFSPIDYEPIDDRVLAPAVEFHDHIIIKPGDDEVMFERSEPGAIGTSWLVLDLSDFAFGIVNLKIDLCFNGNDYISYIDTDIDSRQAGMKAWDVELPPSRRVRVNVALSSGRKTRIAYHYYYYPIGVQNA